MILEQRFETLNKELKLLKSQKKSTRVKAQIYDLKRRLGRIKVWMQDLNSHQYIDFINAKIG